MATKSPRPKPPTSDPPPTSIRPEDRFPGAVVTALRYEYPFHGEGDSDTVVYYETVNGPRENYRGPVPLGARYDGDPQAQLVEERAPVLIAGGANILVERIYARVPKSRTIPMPVNWTVPGFSSESTNIAQTKITARVDYNTFSVQSTAEMQNGGGITIKIPGYTITSGSATISAAEYTVTAKITAISGNNITIDPTNSDIAGRLSLGKKPRVRVNPLRSPDSRVVQGLHKYSYSTNLESLTGSIQSKFQINDSNGESTNEITDTSDPTYSEYIEMIADRELLAAEDAQVSRWWGEIYQKLEIMAYAV